MIFVALTLLLLSIVARAHAECVLHFHDNLPVVMKTDGAHRVMYAQEEGSIKLNETDEVEVHCLTGIL